MGKGRFVAGMIRYAIRQGKIPIFMTDKKKLYAPMWYDMQAVGIPEMLGHEPSILVTDEKANVEVVTTDGKGMKLGTHTHAWTEKRYDEIKENLVEGKENPLKLKNGEKYDAVFTTYTQMQTVHAKKEARHLFMIDAMPNAYLIMDESHLAGGQENPPRRTRRPKLSRSDLLFEQITNAAGAIFASATFAKNAYVMSLYSPKTGLKELIERDAFNVPENSEMTRRHLFAIAMKRFGLPMQQLVSRGLVQDLSYLRREHDFSGVEILNKTPDVSKETYDKFGDMIRAIHEWDTTMGVDVRDAYIRDLEDRGEVVQDPGAEGVSRASQTGFINVMHSIVKQMLLAIKANAAADEAIAAWKAGMKPIIALDSTMEAVFADADPPLGEYAEMDFRATLRRYLNRLLRVHITHSDDTKEHRVIPMDFLTEEQSESFDELAKMIQDVYLPDLPSSPIDWIHYRLRQAGMKTGEITGRGFQFDYTPPPGREVSDGHGTLKKRPRRELTASGMNETISNYNSGELDALVINRSMATGVSAHASKEFKDQRQRMMILIDPPPNIDDFVQVTGRVKRFGQVIDPKYVHIFADIPAEKRVAAVLSGKLKTMNANVTADEKSEFVNEEAVDFINFVGDEIVARMFEEMPWADHLRTLNLDLENRTDFAKKATGKAILLTRQEQEEMYAEIINRFVEFVQQAEESGQNPFGIQVMDYQARFIDSDVYAEATNPGSAFGGEIIATRQNVRVVKKPYKQDAVVRHVLKSYDLKEEDIPSGESPDDTLRRLASDRRAEVQQPEFVDALDADLTQALEALTEKELSPEEHQQRVDQMTTAIRTYEAFSRKIAPGQAVEIKYYEISQEGGDQEVRADYIHGIVTKVPQWNTNNSRRWALADKVTVAVLSPQKEVTLPLGRIDLADAADESALRNHRDTGRTAMRTATGVHVFGIEGMMPVIDGFLEYEGADREEAVILTGNVAGAALDHYWRGNIVVYTTEQGTQEIGLHMRKGFDPLSEKTKKQRQISNEVDVKELLTYLSHVAEDHVAEVDIGDDRMIRLWNGRMHLAIRDGNQNQRAQLNTRVTDVFGVSVRTPGNKGNNPYPSAAWVSSAPLPYISPDALKNAITALRHPDRGIEVPTKHTTHFEAFKNGERAPQPKYRREETMPAEDPLPDMDSIVRRIMEATIRMAPHDVRTEIMDTVQDDSDVPAGFGTLGKYDHAKRLIQVALDSADPLGSFNHEVIHALIAAGLFSRREAAVLVRAADRLGWIERFRIITRYQDLGLSERTEEAIAEAFQEWGKGYTDPPSYIARLFRRIRRFMGEVLIAMRLEGLAPSMAAEVVFSRIHEGEVRAREGRGPRGTADPRYHRAWHGSAWDYEAFTTERVGSGEGAQVYGWGLYFADTRQVADWYKRSVAGAGIQPSKFAAFPDAEKEAFIESIPAEVWTAADGPTDQADFVKNSLRETEGVWGAYNRVHILGAFIRAAQEDQAHGRRREFSAYAKQIKAMEFIRDKLAEIEPAPRTYEVELAPSEDEYLDWDKPFSEQSELVQNALMAMRWHIGGPQDAMEAVRQSPGSRIYTMVRSWATEFGTQAQDVDASLELLQYGIRGIRYMDQLSRRPGRRHLQLCDLRRPRHRGRRQVPPRRPHRHL